MVRRLTKRIYFVFCVFSVAKVGASVLKDASEDHLKELAHNDAAEVIKLEKQKGEKDHHIESIINDDHTDKHSKTTDDLKYLTKDHETKAASESDDYKGSNVKQDKLEDTQSNGYKRGHKKGHHKQGFQNSYHKDESSNKSTYFDDITDEGDQAAYKSKVNSYDNHDGRNYRGSHNNGHEYLKDHYRDGGHNRYGDVGNKRTAHQDYGRKHYLKDLEDYNKYRNGRNSYDRGNIHDHHEYKEPHVYHVPHQEPGWDWQKWEDRRKWEQPAWEESPGWDRTGWRQDVGPGYDDNRGLQDGIYYGSNPGYRYGESRSNPVAEIPESVPVDVPSNAPVVARRKQTITIYEDPRYSGKEGGQLRREEGNYIQLNIKPSTRRYASYDDTYYNLPVREAQASNINRLVYNRRAQS
ncbi:unnamed protein product [Pieris brassicae]|uniref:Uncharacterized protein n=1 Tax=Pieris brassicae TaxID=7116 RepID=A0A9P0T831_PIEBR|nr:unnamed protein product [Pieris brassicae]